MTLEIMMRGQDEEDAGDAGDAGDEGVCDVVLKLPSARRHGL